MTHLFRNIHKKRGHSCFKDGENVCEIKSKALEFAGSDYRGYVYKYVQNHNRMPSIKHLKEVRDKQIIRKEKEQNIGPPVVKKTRRNIPVYSGISDEEFEEMEKRWRKRDANTKPVPANPTRLVITQLPVIVTIRESRK